MGQHIRKCLHTLIHSIISMLCIHLLLRETLFPSFSMPTSKKLKNFRDSSPSPDRENKGPAQACLFVGGFDPRHVKAEKLKTIFGKYGEVLEVNVLSENKQTEDGKQPKHRGYAFVQFKVFPAKLIPNNFKHIYDADSARDSLNNTALDGRTLRVEKAQSPRTLYFTKLDKSWSTKVRMF